MHLLSVFTFLAAISLASSQLNVLTNSSVNFSACEEHVSLLCKVTNLNEKSVIIKWFIGGQLVVDFDGDKNTTRYSCPFSCKLNLAMLKLGEIYLQLQTENLPLQESFSCEVIQSSRDGKGNGVLNKDTLEPSLSKKLIGVYVPVVLTLVAFTSQLVGHLCFKSTATIKKCILCLGSLVCYALIIAGLVLLGIGKDWHTNRRTGLGLVVLPFVGLVIIQAWFWTKDDKRKVILFVALKAVAEVVAIVGLGLAIAQCPPTMAVVIFGLCIIGAVMIADVVFWFIQNYNGSSTSITTRQPAEEKALKEKNSSM
ncbi:leukocyte surface antigen CD47 isoform X2 [Latimeria chalumnae]|uniref:leukocyte surface antigen CD47 isoform X2 n=1 Tax=Latimeria chalumnae TaxID=7897 RepID=UPI00313D30CE